MNLLRFLRKCFTNPPAAVKSAKLVYRIFYSQVYWFIFPGREMPYRLPTGSIILLDKEQSFCNQFWPNVDGYEIDLKFFLMDILGPDSVFIDCGANIGYYSILAHSLVKPNGLVISVEANPITFEKLRKNANRNNINELFLVNRAISSRSGKIELYMPSRGDVFSSLRHQVENFGSDDVITFSIDSCTLDDIVNYFNLEKIDLIKIDIEGSEIDSLRSAVNILKFFRPLIVLEYNNSTWPSFGVSFNDLKDIAYSFQYILCEYNVYKKELVPVSDEVTLRQIYTNVVMKPL